MRLCHSEGHDRERKSDAFMLGWTNLRHPIPVTGGRIDISAGPNSLLL